MKRALLAVPLVVSAILDVRASLAALAMAGIFVSLELKSLAEARARRDRFARIVRMAEFYASRGDPQRAVRILKPFLESEMARRLGIPLVRKRDLLVAARGHGWGDILESDDPQVLLAAARALL